MAVCAAYLPPGAAIDIGDGTALQEPLIEWLGFPRERVRAAGPNGHGGAIGCLTEAALEGPLPSVLSAAAESLVTDRLVGLELAARFRLTLTFDHGKARQLADLTAALPLVLRW